MNDKLVTHADLNTIEDARRWIANVPVGQEAVSGKARVLDLLDRLRVEAEADAPPLPEGWVVLNVDGICERVLWHRDGRLSVYSDGGMAYGEVAANDDRRDRLTPLRPTVTESDVEKAAAEAGRQYGVGGKTWRDTIRAAFAAAGIEVSDR